MEVFLINIQEAKKLLNKIEYDLKQIGNEDEFEHDYNNTDERFEHNLLRTIADKAYDIAGLVEYMNKPITAEGFLTKRADGRYEIEGSGDYLTSGSPVEVWDEDDETYIKTRIEHTNGDYYAYALGSEVKLEGLKARTR